MNQRKPLKRTALKPPTPEQIAKWQAKPRHALPRGERPARVGRRGKRLEAAWQTCKAAVRERSGGFCEGNVAGVCPPGRHSAADTHHVYKSDRASGVHDPARCLHLCRKVHDHLHEHVAWAYEHNLLGRSGSPGASDQAE